jgi:site-specific DNA-methyltransferase (adenine-specific)
MSLDEICSLQVAEHAEEDSALFLWSVWPRIFDAQVVITRWGFEYKTIAWVWVKAKKSGFGFFTGMGYYTRANSEPCLLAVRGRMPVLAHDVLSLIYAPVRRHSQKPDEQYPKIERLYDGPYLELFARKKHSEKWAVWGNEIKSDIDMRV